MRSQGATGLILCSPFAVWPALRFARHEILATSSWSGCPHADHSRTPLNSWGHQHRCSNSMRQVSGELSHAVQSGLVRQVRPLLLRASQTGQPTPQPVRTHIKHMIYERVAFGWHSMYLRTEWLQLQAITLNQLKHSSFGFAFFTSGFTAAGAGGSGGGSYRRASTSAAGTVSSLPAAHRAHASLAAASAGSRSFSDWAAPWIAASWLGTCRLSIVLSECQ